MKTYKEFRPTGFDSHIEIQGDEDRESWLVLPCGRNRDSDCLDESNYYSALKSLEGEGEDVEVHRFGHWACGWFEIIIVRPDTKAAKEAEEIEAALANYSIVLDADDLSEREMQAATETWRNCYSDAQRIEYIRDNRSQFEFYSFVDMLGCVRGKYFLGYASELLNG